jgi:methanethiol S-methyltransferase
MKKAFAIAYGLAAYALFFGTFLYAIGFVGGFVVPKSIDSGPAAPLGEALAVNLGILVLFAVQHTIMARPRFKEWFTGFTPRHLERSTFVAITSLILCLLFWQWRTLPATVWDVSDSAFAPVLVGISLGGWAVVLASSVMIDHFELFGLKQVYLFVTGRAPAPPSFVVRGLYKVVRHPLMLGFLVAFWATPHMTVGHLVFTLGTSGYVLLGTRIEERDLVGAIGDAYRSYQRRVPALIPFTKRAGDDEAAAPTAAA